MTKVQSASNVISDPHQSLQTFDLLDLQQYTQNLRKNGEQGLSSLLRRP
jgi:hypothetical protein